MSKKLPFALPIRIDSGSILVAADCELICHTEGATAQELGHIAHAVNIAPELLAVIIDLLACPELNYDDEPEEFTGKAISRARAALKAAGVDHA